MLAWGNLHWKEKLELVKQKAGNWINKAIFPRKNKQMDSSQLSKINARYINNTLSILGLFLLSVSIIVTEEQNFPGIQALLPVIATVIIILASKDSILNKYILSNKALVWFGSISYPLYLWHWPLLSLAWIIYGEYPGLIYCALTFPICIIISWLTTKLIENPLRFGAYGRTKTLSLFLAMLLIGICGHCIYRKQGLPSRYLEKTDLQQDNEYYKKLNTFMNDSKERCNQIYPDWRKETRAFCRLSKEEGENTIALLGDSHSGHLFLGMAQEAKINEGIIALPVHGATPFLDMTVGKNKKYNKTTKMYLWHKKAYNYILEHPEIKIVLIAHRPFNSFNNAIDRLNPEEKDPRKALEKGIRRTFNFLQKNNRQILIVLDNPKLPFYPTKAKNRPFFGYMSDGSFDRYKYDNDEPIQVYNSKMRRISKDYPNVHLIDLSEILCDSFRCYASRNGKILYSDDNHLSYDGSLYVAPYIMKNIREILK